MTPLPEPIEEVIEDEILTLDEVAARLRVSTRTVRRLVRRRVLSPLRTGRILRFHWPTVKMGVGISQPQPAIRVLRR